MYTFNECLAGRRVAESVFTKTGSPEIAAKAGDLAAERARLMVAAAVAALGKTKQAGETGLAKIGRAERPAAVSPLVQLAKREAAATDGEVAVDLYKIDPGDGPLIKAVKKSAAEMSKGNDKKGGKKGRESPLVAAARRIRQQLEEAKDQ